MAKSGVELLALGRLAGLLLSGGGDLGIGCWVGRLPAMPGLRLLVAGLEGCLTMPA